MTPKLELRSVVAGYGATEVLHGVSLVVGVGGVTALLGANGAGKTTTMRAISGMIARRGTVTFGGTDITRTAPNDIVRMGIAQVPQGRGTFTDLTVADNLRAGAYSRKGTDIDADMQEWYDVFPRLQERRLFCNLDRFCR